MNRKRPAKKVTWYLRQRKQEKRTSVTLGIVLTIAVHAGIYSALSFTGLDYIYPPPQEKTMLIDFSEWEIEKTPQVIKTSKPTAPKPDKTKPIELVKESKAQNVGTKENLAKEATVGDKGDVETPEPPREKPIDRRALFSAADNKTDKDTLAAQTSREITEKLEAGHAEGNVKKGETSGVPNAELEGRIAVNGIPKPKYVGQESGTVVVDIWVDPNGRVVKAEVGAANRRGEYTNTTNKQLYEAAIQAAKSTQFEPDRNAPETQKGTITYVFIIKAN